MGLIASMFGPEEPTSSPESTPRGAFVWSARGRHEAGDVLIWFGAKACRLRRIAMGWVVLRGIGKAGRLAYYAAGSRGVTERSGAGDAASLRRRKSRPCGPAGSSTVYDGADRDRTDDLLSAINIFVIRYLKISPDSRFYTIWKCLQISEYAIPGTGLESRRQPRDGVAGALLR